MHVQSNPAFWRLARVGGFMTTAALATGCSQPQPDLEISLAQVGRGAVTLDVHTGPDLFLSTLSDLVGGEPKTDANGDGTLIVELGGDMEHAPSEWRSGHFVVNVVAPGLLGNDGVLDIGGSDVVAQDSIDLDFRPLHLGLVPEAPTDSWIVPLGFRDISLKHNCLRLKGDNPAAPKLGLIADGDRFTGATGTKVTMPGASFEIGESGLGKYEFNAAAVLPLLFVTGSKASFSTDVEVLSPGLAPSKFTYKATLARHCSKLVGDELRQKVNAREPLLDAGAPTGNMAVVAYASGDLDTQGRDYTPVKKGKRKGLTDPKRLVDARFVFIDTEVSRTKGARCESTSQQPVIGRPGKVQLVTTTYEPDFVDTKIRMYSVPDYEELDSRELTADRTRCAAEVFGSAPDLRHWINTRIEEHAG